MLKGERGANMKRGPSPCDFCGSVQGFQCYPTDVPGADWYACANCVALIRIEDWDNLIDRSIAAYMALRPRPRYTYCRWPSRLSAASRLFLHPASLSRRVIPLAYTPFLLLCAAYIPLKVGLSRFSEGFGNHPAWRTD